MTFSRSAKAIAGVTVTLLTGSTGLMARDIYKQSKETSAAQEISCRLVAGVSLDYPVGFTPDPPWPPVPGVIESADSYSGISEGVRLKVSRVVYVQGTALDARQTLDGTLSYWQKMADGGKVNSQIQPRTVSGIEGSSLEATLTAQGSAYRGQILALVRDRILWQFITMYPDTPFGRTLIQRALSSVKVPGDCG
jgi:hypothetical protein